MLPPKTSEVEIKQIFAAQMANQYVVGKRDVKQRLRALKNLQNAIEKEFREELCTAVNLDFGKPTFEVELTEIFALVQEIKFARQHLSDWLSQTVPTPLALMGSTSKIVYEPKGVCLIIAPWNFPVDLALSPLIAAIAGGNTVVLKPSEHTPHTSAVLKKLILATFKENEVAVVLGGVEVSTALLDLPFHHIFFTGSTAVGKIVMAAAAKNLTSVTLELGGKSPVIIDETANLKIAAKRIAWAKFINAGQTCIAPDYVFVAKNVQEKFLVALENVLQEFYKNEALTSNDFAQIINPQNFNRLKGYLDEAVNSQAKMAIGGKIDAEKNKIEPTVITYVSPESKLMQEEIFGPILPLFTFEKLEEVIDFIQQRDKPLALYMFSKSKKNTAKLMAETRAGGTCINHCLVHFSNHELPFGGANASGLGKSHGHFGFLEFTNARAVYQQILPSAGDVFHPPYSSFKQKLIRFVIKYL